MNVGRIEYAPDYRSLRVGTSAIAKSWDSIARAYVERTPTESVAVETFGELHSGGVVDGGKPYIVGERPSPSIAQRKPRYEPRPRSDDPCVPEWLQPAPTTIANLVNYPGFVYVGSPYSKYRDGHSAAAGDVSVVAGALMRLGLVVYVPIAHGHYISMHDSRLPATWEFWKRQCQPMIDAASALVVVTMDGWDESVGLAHEIACFLTARKPVIYVDPDEAYDMAGGAEGLWKVAA